jgi:hypothetical protein
MSTFAVFGVTKSALRPQVERRLHRDLAKHKKAVTVDEFAQLREQALNREFDAAPPRKVSGMFDAPQRAAEFAELSVRMGDGKNLVVKARVRIERPNGKMGWTWQEWAA